MRKSFAARFFAIFLLLTLLALGVHIVLNGFYWDAHVQEKAPAAFFSILITSWALSQAPGIFQLVKAIFPWLMVFFIVFAGYVFRHDLSGVGQRLQGGLLPHAGQEAQPGSMRFTRANDGHFHIQARVNQVPITFLADTGATDIIIDQTTARRLGIDVSRLQLTQIYHTANGTVRAAPTFLQRFQLGSLELFDLPVSVNEVPMSQPLLGMSFFNRLKRFDMQEDQLTIHWNVAIPSR
ncbi:MAG: TIGR02281 family clan AA aspartic protease [Magnetococcales bacterium]|nr:TIGR02281 family clan AA aspartic protease [Magnetococcales bacterium]